MKSKENLRERKGKSMQKYLAKTSENYQNNEKGITLIALVVTIVVLIVLATVSINAIFGEEGLIAKAEQAKELQALETEKEALELIKAAAITNIKNAGKLTVDGYIDALIEQEKIDETDITDNGDGTKTAITDNGYVVTISPNPENENDIIIEIEGKADALPVKIKELKLTTSTNSIKVDVEVKRGEGATYKYYYKTESETDYTKAYEGSNLSYTIEKLTQNVTYNIRVEATNENGTVAKEATGRTGEIGTAVGVITFGEVSWNNGKAEIVITKTTQDDLKMQYRILDKENTEIKEYTEIASGEKITGLNSGDKVVARLWDGTNGGSTAVANILDLEKPTVTVTQGTITSTSIQVNVQATDNESGIATYSYYIKLSTDAEYPTTATATTTDASYTFTNLSQNMSYDIKVEVSDVAGNTESGELKNKITNYTIIYDANGGSGAPEEQTVSGTTVKLSETVPTRNGFTFLGWSTSSSATSETYKAGDDYTEGKPATLYAVWQINTVYYTGSGSAGNNIIAVTTGRISKPGNGATIEVTIPSEGYEISASVSGGAVSFNGTTIVSGGGTSASYTTTEAGTLTLTAGTTITLTIDEIAVPLEFQGYTITYSTNGGSWRANTAQLMQWAKIGSTYTILSGSSANYWYKDGYDFLGYSTDPNATEATYAEKETITPTGDMTLYAIWTPSAAGTVLSEKMDTWTSDYITPIADGYGGKIPLPSDFYYVGGDIESGIIISDSSADANKGTSYDVASTLEGNQFVWIPVTESEFTRTNFDSSGNPTTGAPSSGINMIYCSEPCSSGYETEESEYNTMYSKVIQYGGFYIARYEAGDETNGTTLRTTYTTAHTVVSKKGVVPYNYVPWGKSINDPSEIEGKSGAVYLSKKMYASSNSVTSTLCYGVQWDSMCRYIGDGYRTTPTKEAAELTGSVVTDVSKNIYDLAGNCKEWTMETSYSNVYYRCIRGGRYNGADSVTYRTSLAPEFPYVFVTFRPTLYIK